VLTTRLTSRLLLESITFSGTGGIFNLSRHDPAKVSHGVGTKTYFHANGGSGPLTFVSTVVVSECHLIDVKLNLANGRSLKTIEGACIEGEMERMVGAIGQIINQVDYKGQIQAGYISFSTSFSRGDAGMSQISNMSMHVNLHFTVASSPSAGTSKRHVSGPNPFSRGPSGSGTVLSCHDIGESCHIL
jgi:hypothetical protein